MKIKSKNLRAKCPLHWVTVEDACATLSRSSFFRLQVNPVNPVNPIKKIVRAHGRPLLWDGVEEEKEKEEGEAEEMEDLEGVGEGGGGVTVVR